MLELAAWFWHHTGDTSCNEQGLLVPQGLLCPVF